jgi:nucleoid DNA-binding protein
MLNIPIEDALTELASTIAEGLAAGEDVVVSGFGRFEVRHIPTHVEPHGEGGAYLQPPHNVVVFESSFEEV